ENLLDRQIEGETLSEAEWKRFEELTELAAGLKEQDELRERIYLDDYVKDDELFQAYPEMKRTRLEFVDLPSADYCGGYLHPDNRIVINISRTDDVRSVLAVTRNFAASLFRNIKYFTLRKLYLCRKWMQKRLQKTTTTGITLPNFDFLA
ncbi:hypothetical protein, partial [Phocaeicola vulgatus]|uniref:hypothetical protein n=1 Tax=Phocaeicola vulgatus TaxID=821 RepID=UPI00216B3A1E